MPTSVPRAPKLAVAVVGAALVLALAADRAGATGGHFNRGGMIETVYAPSAVALPTSYVATSYAPTALYVPTSYSSVLYPTVYTGSSLLTPTAYTSSSLLTPTAYTGSSLLSPTVYTGSSLSTPSAYIQPTSYLVETHYGSRLRRSAYRPAYTATSRSYLLDYAPTSYLSTAYWPTTYAMDLPALTTPTATVAYVDDCTGVASAVQQAPVQQVPAQQAPVQQAPPAAAAPAQGGNPPQSLDSTPSNSGPPAAAPRTQPGANEPAFNDDDFPAAPRPDANDFDLPSISPPGSADPNAQRSSFRPAPTEMRPQPSLSPVGALRGEVLSDGLGGGQPAPGVKVIFEDAMKRYPDRSVASDLQGRFEILLPDGDWRVNVEKGDGTLTPYSTITVAAGRFFSEAGRAVSSLRLHQ